MTSTVSEILAKLLAMQPRPTAEAPGDSRGIYGLVDHHGDLRYIGSTSSECETFRKRIHHRHRTGSETHSHYFSRMYNTGRMWRLRDDPSNTADGAIAKRLRSAFVAKHCAAVWVPLPDNADIARLERQVISLAPPEVKAWNSRGMEVYPEPIELVDELVEQLALNAADQAALERQRARFEERGGAPRRERNLAAPANALLPMFPTGPFRFFALDVETANGDRGSICQVGVACVKLDDSIEKWATLVDPRTTQWVFTSLHGIDPGMVRGAPCIDVVLDTLEPLLKGCKVYQHSGFDRSAIRAACGALGRDEPAWEWRDSVAVARHAWPELKGEGGHGLASLKSHLGLQFEHHDAGEDARAAAQVVLLAEAQKAATEIRKSGSKEKGPPAPMTSMTIEVPSADPAATVVARTQLTQANLKHHHFYLRKSLDAFPRIAIDASKKVNGSAGMLTVEWGPGVISKTDICGRHKFFRDRANTRAFFERTCARPGDIVEVERIPLGHYRVVLRRG